MQVKSFASRNQLAVTQTEIDEGVVLEWDRRYIAVLGVAGKRLYEFRLQVGDGRTEGGWVMRQWSLPWLPAGWEWDGGFGWRVRAGP